MLATSSRRPSRPLIVLTGLGLLASLSACSISDTTLDPGEAVRAGPDAGGSSVSAQTDSRSLSAQLPSGSLEVAWSGDRDLLAGAADLHDRAVVSSGGADLLLVTWKRDVTDVLSRGVGQYAVHGEPETDLALLSGGGRTVLDVEGLGLDRGTVVAAVADRDDVALEVTFDAVTQTIGPEPDARSVPDEAAVLYDSAPSAGFRRCVTATAPVSCRAEAQWLPWVAGEGWAPAGQLWPVVRVEGLASTTDASPATSISVDLRASLDGATPLSAEDVGAPAGGFNQLLVFPASSATSTRLEVQLSVQGTGSSTQGTARLDQGS